MSQVKSETLQYTWICPDRVVEASSINLVESCGHLIKIQGMTRKGLVQSHSTAGTRYPLCIYRCQYKEIKTWMSKNGTTVIILM